MSRPVRWISLAIACGLALPIPLGIFAGLHLRLSPFLFLQTLLARSPLVPLAALGGVVLGIILLRERWFCRNVCPTGALCDAVSACRKRRRGWELFPRVNQALALAALAAAACGVPVLAVLDPVAIFHGAWGVAHAGLTAAAVAGVAGLAALLLLSLLFPRLWCARLCPLGGLQLLAADLRRAFRRKPKAAPAGSEATEVPSPAPPRPSWGRRHLLAAVSGVAAGVAVRGATADEMPTVLRPPGAQPEGRFKTACCRCGNCARACPTGIIRSALDARDPLGLLAPQLDFTNAYCLPGCAACGQACPSGAIVPFSVGEKKKLIIGAVEINLEECLLTEGKECDRCVTVCAYEAIRIEGGLFEPAPEVDVPRCVGCGACVAVCPAGVIAVRPEGGAKR